MAPDERADFEIGGCVRKRGYDGRADETRLVLYNAGVSVVNKEYDGSDFLRDLRAEASSGVILRHGGRPLVNMGAYIVATSLIAMDIDNARKNREGGVLVIDVRHLRKRDRGELIEDYSNLDKKVG